MELLLFYGITPFLWNQFIFFGITPFFKYTFFFIKHAYITNWWGCLFYSSKYEAYI